MQQCRVLADVPGINSFGRVSPRCFGKPLQQRHPFKGSITRRQPLRSWAQYATDESPSASTVAIKAEAPCKEEVLAAGPSPRSQLSQWTPASIGLRHGTKETRLASVIAAAAAAGGLMGSGFSLEGPGSTLEALAVLAAIVTVHECGHFLAARWQGIHVSKFSIGFGPSLYTYQGKNVEYSVRLFPLGGYVAFPEDDPANNYPADDPDLLKNRSIAQRATVISAGVVANCIFAFAALFVQVATIGKAETAYLAGVRIPDVVASSAAARAGLQAGDLVLRVGDFEVPATDAQVSSVVQRIRASPSEQLVFTVERDGALVQVPCVPDVMDNGRGMIGVQLVPNAYIKHTKANSLPEVFTITMQEFGRLAGTVAGGLKKIFTNFSKMASQLTGPVAIVAAGSEIARTDAAGLFQFCAIVNINLAAVNILPLPALDGGYLLLLALEAVRGKKLDATLERGFMTSGLLVLMAAGITLIIRDTLNLLP